MRTLMELKPKSHAYSFWALTHQCLLSPRPHLTNPLCLLISEPVWTPDPVNGCCDWIYCFLGYWVNWWDGCILGIVFAFWILGTRDRGFSFYIFIFQVIYVYSTIGETEEERVKLKTVLRFRIKCHISLLSSLQFWVGRTQVRLFTIDKS